jgi:2-oxoglutarate ferredoxin oxidoreductase subunit beta
MTGGQMAPTTLVGMKATTAPLGRDSDHYGFPMKVAEMIASHDGSYYVERVSVDSTKNIIGAKKAIKKAFQYQVEGKGFTFIEVLSTCPSNWAKTPVESIKWLQENMIPAFPLGVKKDKGGEA